MKLSEGHQKLAKGTKSPGEGCFVVCPDGSVGMLHERRNSPHKCAVKFGADGPIRYFSWRNLHRATGKDIVEAGLLGVGCSPDQEKAASKYARQASLTNRGAPAGSADAEQAQVAPTGSADARRSPLNSAGADNLPCSTYHCLDRLWCIQRGICKRGGYDAPSDRTAPAGSAAGRGEPMTLAELITNERRHRGMSLQEVADASGMTKSHIWELEDGRSRNPTVKAIYGISVALGVPFTAVCDCALRSVK